MGESAPIKSAKRDSLTVAAIKLKLLLKKYIRNTSNRRHSVEFDFIITAEDNTVSLFHLYLQCHRLENRMQSCKVPSERESARGGPVPSSREGRFNSPAQQQSAQNTVYSRFTVQHSSIHIWSIFTVHWGLLLGLYCPPVSYFNLKRRMYYSTENMSVKNKGQRNHVWVQLKPPPHCC